MSPFRWMGVGTRSALAAVMVLAALTPAFAIEVLSPGDRQVLILQGRGDEVQMLENRLQRRQFQQQQLQVRAQDREIARPGEQRPEIPVMKPRCKLQVFGAGFLRSCR